MNKRVASIVFAIPFFKPSVHIPASIREVSARTWFFEIWTEIRVCSSLKRDLLNCRLPRRNQEVIIERKPEGELGLELLLYCESILFFELS